jgi:hypothetical protein
MLVGEFEPVFRGGLYPNTLTKIAVVKNLLGSRVNHLTCESA